LNSKLQKIKVDLLVIVGCLCLSLVLIELTSSYFDAFVLFFMTTVALFLLHFSRKAKKTELIFLRIALITFVITLFEICALLHYRVFILNAEDAPRYNYGRTQYWVEDDELGFKPNPSVLINARKRMNSNVIYDTDYSFTSDALRTTKSNKKPRCTFLFFGGSRVFGEGLPDIQALPYQFSRKLNYNYNVLNYAFHGYGPHQMLRVLETGSSDLSKGKIAVIFYLLAPDDLNKITGNLERFRRGPKYILKEGKLKYVGDLTGIGGIYNSHYDFKNSVISLLRHSQLINSLFKFIMGENSEELDKHYELLLGVINEAGKLAREKYNSKFVIILQNEENSGNNMLIKLTKNNINYIEISRLLSQDLGEHYFLQDGINFNEKINNEIATGLANRYGDCNQ